MLRGGAFNNNADNLRSSDRNNNEPGNSNNNIGFRLARDVERGRFAGLVARAAAITVAAGAHFHFRTAFLAPDLIGAAPNINRVPVLW